MSGREIFDKYKNVISCVEKIFLFFPKFIRVFIYNLIFYKPIRLLIRYFELRKIGEKVGFNIYISENVVLKNMNNFKVGKNLSIHEFCYIDAAGGIEIGDNVSIAHNCSLVSFEHTWADLKTPIKYNPTKLNSIKIGNDVWLGCGVRVLSGSVIEDRVIVAAGAVVKGILESGYLYGGVPVRKLKKL